MGLGQLTTDTSTTINTYEENATLSFYNSDTLLVERNADVCKFKQLVLEFNKQCKLNQYNWKEIVFGIRLRIDGGGKQLTEIPLILLCELTTPTISNNKLTITIPDYLIFDIMLIALKYHEIRLWLLYNNDTCKNNIISANLLVECVFFNVYGRKVMTQKTHQDIFQQLNMGQIIQGKYTCVHFENSSFTKGYFICTPVANIKSITLLSANGKIFTYDETMINTHCNKLSDGLLYVPITYSDSPNFTSKTTESYDQNQVLNLPYDNKVQMRLELNDILDLSVYSLNGRTLTVTNGFIKAINSLVDEDDLETSTNTSKHDLPIEIADSSVINNLVQLT